MDVASIMTRPALTVAPDASLDAAMAIMDECAIRHLPVTEGTRLVGVLSDRDLLEATGWLPARVHDARHTSKSPRGRVVRELMTDPVMTISEADSVVTIAVEAVVQGIGCLPVVQGDEVIGIVTEMDLLGAFVDVSNQADPREGADPPVRQLMTKDPTTIPVGATLDEARALFQQAHGRHLPVLQGAWLVGILSDRDVRRGIGAGRAGDYPVDELMTRAPTTLDPEAPVSQAARDMIRLRISAVPVVDDNELVGIVTSTDLLDHCMNHLREASKPA